MSALMRKALCQVLVLSMMVCAPLVPAQAAIVGTDAAMAMSDRAAAIARINDVLMRDEVRDRLESLGVDPADALVRVDALTDAELAQLQQRLDDLPAGGDVIGVLGVLLVVLLVLELLGVTNVFTGL